MIALHSTMASEDPDLIRAILAELGRRRERLRGGEEVLADETKKAIKRAIGVLPMTEVADLVGLDRTTLYKVYRP